jgi:AraC family transcriptional regulator of adaptative response/methylated-DNA-[protein]-cysteine methyltransferase
MMTEDQNYLRIAQAIEYIQQNFKAQPSLAQIAAHLHLSPAHFQRMFSAWAGISPKKFLQYISLEYAKAILKNHQAQSLLDVAFETGFSSASRLHDLFIHIEGMSPAEYRNGGESLAINYSIAQTIFGAIVLASTTKGLCYMAFFEDQAAAVLELKAQFPKAQFIQHADQWHSTARQLLQTHHGDLSELKLHLKGSPFQLKVWASLVKIPMGELTSYGAIAKEIGQPQASRAVGAAVAHNPVAFLIPIG